MFLRGGEGERRGRAALRAGNWKRDKGLQILEITWRY